MQARLAMLNRLVGPADHWLDASSLLHEICQAFGLKSVGLRWPAEGPAIVVAETLPGGKAQMRFPVPVANQAPGILWAEGPEAESEFLRLIANVLGNAAVFRKLLGTVADQARIAQRLDDAARVAGRVAHDLDNVFQGVVGFAALALEQLKPGSPPHQHVQEVRTSAQHGLKFTAQLHQLSRGGLARPLPALVPAALAREIGRLSEEHPSLRFDVEVPNELPAVAIESGLLQMLLGLLLDNAAEATPSDGVVRVQARMVELTAVDLTTLLGSPALGPHVEVRITDRGPGLTDEARRNVFVEPFFTTKYRHRGLSLAVAFRMIYAHRGGVKAESPAGQGTTIRLVLPLAALRVPAIHPAVHLEVP